MVAGLTACLSAGTALAQDDGAALFSEVCAACHNEGGIGSPGLAPPLDRPDFWQALGDDAPAYLAGVLTKGIAMSMTIRGERYMGMVMPAVEGYSDDELSSVSNWVLATLGETDKTLSADDIAATRDGALSRADLKAMRPKTE